MRARGPISNRNARLAVLAWLVGYWTLTLGGHWLCALVYWLASVSFGLLLLLTPCPNMRKTWAKPNLGEP